MNVKNDPSIKSTFAVPCEKCGRPISPSEAIKSKTGERCKNCMPQCSKCLEHKPIEECQVSKKGFICQECKGKKRKHLFITIVILLLLLLAGMIIWGLCWESNNNNKTAKGFEGVSNINDSIGLQVTDPDFEYNLSNITLTSLPVSHQTPIDNLQSFKRELNQSIELVKQDKSSVLAIPVSVIKFEFNSDEVSTEGEELLDEIAKLYMGSSQSGKIEIQGYACNIGGDEPNNKISYLRAERVKSFLIKYGVPEKAIILNWYGKSKNSEFNLPSNEDYRRVLIKFIN